MNCEVTSYRRRATSAVVVPSFCSTAKSYGPTNSTPICPESAWYTLGDAITRIATERNAAVTNQDTAA